MVCGLRPLAPAQGFDSAAGAALSRSRLRLQYDDDYAALAPKAARALAGAGATAATAADAFAAERAAFDSLAEHLEVRPSPPFLSSASFLQAILP